MCPENLSVAASRLFPSLWVQLGLFLLCSGTFYRKEDYPVVTEHEAVPGLAKQDLCSASGCKKFLQHYLRWQFGPPCSLRFATNSKLRSGASKQVSWENGSKYFCLQFKKRKRKKKKLPWKEAATNFSRWMVLCGGWPRWFYFFEWHIPCFLNCSSEWQ